MRKEGAVPILPKIYTRYALPYVLFFFFLIPKTEEGVGQRKGWGEKERGRP